MLRGAIYVEWLACFHPEKRMDSEATDAQVSWMVEIPGKENRPSRAVSLTLNFRITTGRWRMS